MAILIAMQAGFSILFLAFTFLPLHNASGAMGDTATIGGVVRDSQGAVIVEARVTLRDARQAMVGNALTDPQGRFRFSGLAPGSYLLIVNSPGFAEQRRAIHADRITSKEHFEITLKPHPMHVQITVTANPGQVEDAVAVSQSVNVIAGDKLQERLSAASGVAEIANEEAGLYWQKTSPTIGGLFVRGLTGNKVNVFIDRVRYSTSAARGGINTFLNLIDAGHLETVEILRGPNSAQYGSDALGGSVQLLTRVPQFSAGRATIRGTHRTFFKTADASFGSNLTTSIAARRFGMVVSLAGRRINTLRTGKGIDSHSAFTRFLGLPSSLFIKDRLPDTAFTQYGGLIKMNWSPTTGSQLIVHYSRGQQDGGKRYDQLLGGDGNLVADLRNLMLDFFYVRYDKIKLGWFDSFSATYSFNSQREERVNQGGNGNPRASITHEFERTIGHGFQTDFSKQWTASHHLWFGGEFYSERMHAPSFALDPVTQMAAPRRPRVPDQARYKSGGAYAQNVFGMFSNRLRVVGNVRYSGASYRARAEDSPLVNGARLWPNDSLRASDFTFRLGLVGAPSDGWNLSANLSRGFRAPHMTDLGTLGLTGAGFEVAAPDVTGFRATIGSTAGRDAVSSGRPVEQVSSETSLAYEVGVRYRKNRLAANFTFFLNDLNNIIEKQALILPPGAVGQRLGGQTIVAQNANGAVFVETSTNPVLVRANFGDVRVRGFEHAFDWGMTPRWSMGGVFTYLHARDKASGAPPNLEGGTPAPDGYLSIRYTSPHERFWLEPSLHAAGRQDRLSSLALEDRRTGALRSRTSIRNFFLNGATARGLVSAGPDGRFGTADDTLIATGETLAQIHDRVLGPGVDSAPLFRALPGYLTLNLRAGLRLSRDGAHRLLLNLENIADRNYRGISWGLDAPGRSLSMSYSVRF